MKRWSKLQKDLYLLISPDIEFQIHCVSYPMRSQNGSESLPRYWITLGKEIIWDYPKDFLSKEKKGNYKDPENGNYPYVNEASDISNLIREYIDTPKNDLLDKVFENDKWGLTDIFKAADRRISAKRLRDLFENKYTNATALLSSKRNKYQTIWERAIIAKKALEDQEPVSYEEALAQVKWLKETSSNNEQKKKRLNESNLKYNLFLDDIRSVNQIYEDKTDTDFVIVRSYNEFKKAITEKGLPEFISFDNDLGPDENGNIDKDGYAAAKWLVYDSGLDLRNLKFNVHSANPVAAEQIRGLLENYIRHLNEIAEE